MKDIKTIPIDELIKDRVESIADSEICRIAIRQGILNYSGGSVQDRLEVNEMIVIKINSELKRRATNANQGE